LPIFDPNRVRDIANNDGEFAVAARLWDCAIRIKVGASPYRLVVANGRVDSFAREAGGANADIEIAGPQDEWEEAMKPVPRPFLHDLFGAQWREHFTVEGDMLTYCAYYPALRRLFEIMRASAQHKG